MSYADTPRRTTRHFQVYKGERLVLSVEDTPGLLFSQASPPPGGAPNHPFVNARAYDAMTEGDLADLLWSSDSFDDFLKRVIHAGFNIASWNDSSVVPRPQGYRLYREDELVGALWFGMGQFTTLQHQPPHDALVFEHGTITTYAEGEADTLLTILQQTSTFSDLERLLRDADYQLTEIEHYQP